MLKFGLFTLAVAALALLVVKPLIDGVSASLRHSSSLVLSRGR